MSCRVVSCCIGVMKNMINLSGHEDFAPLLRQHVRLFYRYAMPVDQDNSIQFNSIQFNSIQLERTDFPWMWHLITKLNIIPHCTTCVETAILLAHVLYSTTDSETKRKFFTTIFRKPTKFCFAAVSIHAKIWNRIISTVDWTGRLDSLFLRINIRQSNVARE